MQKEVESVGEKKIVFLVLNSSVACNLGVKARGSERENQQFAQLHSQTHTIHST
jgi:hypothetical protein